MENLKELKASLDNFDKKYKELKSNNSTNDNNSQMMDYMYECLSSLRNYIYGAEDRLHSRLDIHMYPPGKIHPPHLLTASHVENYLEMCGMDNDCEIVKPKITMKASQNGKKEFSVDLKVKK